MIAIWRSFFQGRESIAIASLGFLSFCGMTGCLNTSHPILGLSFTAFTIGFVLPAVIYKLEHIE